MWLMNVIWHFAELFHIVQLNLAYILASARSFALYLGIRHKKK